MRDIDVIICCGDFTDGYYPRRSAYSKYQLFANPDDMAEYAANVHPFSQNITFYSIAGNHDATYLDSHNIDIMDKISKKRPDIVYLGQDKANINFDGVTIHLFHGYGKRNRSIEKRVQKYYDLIANDDKPDIIQLGHIHKSYYTQFDKTFIFQTAALIDQTPNLDSLGFSCEKSCWFATFEYDSDGNLINVIPQLERFEDELVRKI